MLVIMFVGGMWDGVYIRLRESSEMMSRKRVYGMIVGANVL